MRASVIVKTYPVAYNAAGVLDILEAMPMRALFFERTDDTLNHAVLLRAVRRDELLAQPVASRQRGVAARREDQSVVRSQQERRRHAPQCSETGDQGVFQGTASGAGLAATRQMPAEQLAGMTVDQQRQRGSAIPARPDTA